MVLNTIAQEVFIPDYTLQFVLTEDDTTYYMISYTK